MPASTPRRSERVLHIQRARGWRSAPALRATRRAGAADCRFRRPRSPALRFPISTLSDGRRPAVARGAKPRARLRLHRVLSGGIPEHHRYARRQRPRATAQNESSTSSGHEAGAPRQPCVPPAAQARRNGGSDAHSPLSNLYSLRRPKAVGGTRGEAPCSLATSSRPERWNVRAPPIRAMPPSTSHPACRFAGRPFVHPHTRLRAVVSAHEQSP